MELRQLRHFVAVAEELHFGRAARRLRMAQPPLSQSIMRLEESLGAKLFERSSREVRLTPAGAALLSDARGILERADAAELAVKLTASAESTVLRVGFVPMSSSPALPQAIREFRKHRPRVEIELHELASAAQLQRLRRGALDVAFVAAGHDLRGLSSAPLGRFGPVVAVPERWPLARGRSVRLAELKGLPLVLFPQQLTPPYFPELSSACRRAGFVPNVGQRVTQPYTMLTLVAQEMGVGFVPASAQQLAVAGVAFVPVRDLLSLSTRSSLSPGRNARRHASWRNSLHSSAGSMQQQMTEAIAADLRKRVRPQPAVVPRSRELARRCDQLARRKSEGHSPDRRTIRAGWLLLRSRQSPWLSSRTQTQSTEAGHGGSHRLVSRVRALWR
jgi:DNA-binding transcriptional LysR family regulator